MNDTTLCHDTTYNITQSLCIYYLLLAPLKMLMSLLTDSDGSLRWVIDFSFDQKTILVIGLLRVWVLLSESATKSVTLSILLYLLASKPVILANGHWLRGQVCFSIWQCHQLSNFFFYHSIFVWFVNFAETLFSICAITLQHATRVSTFFWNIDLVSWKNQMGNDNICLHC